MSVAEMTLENKVLTPFVFVLLGASVSSMVRSKKACLCR